MDNLNVGLIGTGAIGRAHLERLNHKLSGARVTACSDPNADFGASVAKEYRLRSFASGEALINDPDIDAVMVAAADAYHEQYVLAAIVAGKYVFCEKPLAPTADACKRIVDAEVQGGKKLVQVGFMRRYDPGYRQLKEAIESGRYGEPLLLHCAHRNPAPPSDWNNSSAVENSMLHEIDVLRWLLGEDYVSAEVRFSKTSRRAEEGLHDPQTMILTTGSGVRIDIEHYVNTGHSYDIRCEVVCEDAVLNLPQPASIEILSNAVRGKAIDRDWSTRFADAYDIELQEWINATRENRVDGPTAWDGYACQIAASAASLARETQTVQPVMYAGMPDFYKN